MANVQNLEGLINKLRRLKDRVKEESEGSVIVGYTAAYALAVHENIEMKWQGKPRRSGIGVYWGPRGQAKFLEQPFRLLESDGTLFEIVKNAMKAGKTLLQGLMMSGLMVQRESQLLVPVEYGNLKASAFTRLEGKE